MNDMRNSPTEREKEARITAILASADPDAPKPETFWLEVTSALNVLGAVTAKILAAMDDDTARNYLGHVYEQSRAMRALVEQQQTTVGHA